ncbi:MAG: cytochrome c oxidase subunit 3 [Williamsia sp.]|nr:cytochrome c oxidase subunit 3 [Williamsia sp.]
MMFAGLTSAYIVKSNQPKWIMLDLPVIFSYSTAVIILSSITIQIALKEFKERKIALYRNMLALTFVLGVLFIFLQLLGFNQLWSSGITLRGAGAAPFMYVIFGLHGLHVVGGIIALLIIFIKAFSRRNRSYDPISIEVASTYWHFVDALWIYLFIFFMWIQ